MTLELKPKDYNPKRSIIDKMNGGSNSSKKKKRSQRLLLLLALALGVAMVSVMLLHKLRQGRVLGLLLQDQEREISALQLVLQKERENSKETKMKWENMRSNNFILRKQMMELTNKLTQTQTTIDHLQKMRNELEASLEEKQNQIEALEEKAEESIRTHVRVAEITELSRQKETEVEEAKQQIKKLSTPENNTILQDRTIENSSNANEDIPKEGKDGVMGEENDQMERPSNSQGSTMEVNEEKELEPDKSEAGEMRQESDEEPKKLRVAEITELLKRKETELEEEKQQLERLIANENNTTLQNGTIENISNANEMNNEGIPKDEKLVNLQTTVDDKPGEDGENMEASENHQLEKTTNSQETQANQESTAEVNEQNEELTSGEEKLESEEEKERESDKAEESEMRQESTMEVQEQSKEAENDQETVNNLEKVVGASRNEQQEKPKIKEPKVRRNKNRGKGRRRWRKGSDSVRGVNIYVNKEKNKGMEGKHQERTHATSSSEIHEVSNSDGQSNSEAMAEAREDNDVSTNQQPEDGGGGLEVEGDGINKILEVENKEITSISEQPEKPDNFEDNKTKNENSDDKTGAATDKESDAQTEYGVVKEKDDNTKSFKKQTDAENTAENGEVSKINIGVSTEEITSKKKHSEGSESSQEDKAENDDSDDETGDSVYMNSEKEDDAKNQDEAIKEESGVNAKSITEQSDTNNDADDHQSQISEKDDKSSGSETKDQEETT